VLRFHSVLTDAPLQIYCSALVFAPERSLIRQTLVDQVPETIKMLSMKEADWDACRSTLEGHSPIITYVDFSPDGQVLCTDRGDISLPQTPVITSLWRSQPQSFYVQVQDQWILRNQQLFLWLPPEYRSTLTAVCEDMACLGACIWPSGPA
jgi:hypothetical protein